MSMVKPTLLLEEDLFYEDEIMDTKSIISKYFEIEPVDQSRINVPILAQKEFRTSLNMARRMKVNTKPYDCTSWVPYLRDFMISPSTTQFAELGYLKKYKSSKDFPMFIRPNNGYKTFSGQVFPTAEAFKKECLWLEQQNIGDDLLCMFDDGESITLEKEYRCVFIDHKLVDMCRYMSLGEKDVVYEYDKQVAMYAEVLMLFLVNKGFALNIPNLVIDVCYTDSTIVNPIKQLSLIEINMFETASFYSCDIDKIYKAWQKQVNNL